MTFSTWFAFVVVTALACAAPGPNMLMMFASGTRQGLGRTLPLMCGCFVAIMVMLCLSLAGVSALLKTAPRLFDALRFAGALYLIYLGIESVRAPVHSVLAPGKDAGAAAQAPSAGARFRSGFYVGISNPKVMLYTGAVFPQFMDPQSAQTPQLAILLLTFAVLEFGWYTAYAVAGKGLQRFFMRPRAQKIFNVVTGLLFIGLGAVLVVA